MCVTMHGFNSFVFYGSSLWECLQTKFNKRDRDKNCHKLTILPINDVHGKSVVFYLNSYNVNRKRRSKENRIEFKGKRIKKFYKMDDRCVEYFMDRVKDLEKEI